MYSSNNEKINHKIIKIEGEEYKDKERQKEKYLDLLSEIYKFHFIKANFLFLKDIYPSFPDAKDNNWQKKYLDEIEILFNKQNNINNNKINILKDFKICKRIIKKFLDKINFKLPFFIFILILKAFIKNIKSFLILILLKINLYINKQVIFQKIQMIEVKLKNLIIIILKIV